MINNSHLIDNQQDNNHTFIPLNFMSLNAISLEKKPSSLGRSEELINRRKAIVPDGVGIYSRTTAAFANGGVITDVDGKEYIDFGGGIGVLNAGHCPESVVKAIQVQAEKLIHSCFISTYEVYVELCEKLASILPHGDATKVMLTNSGAESVENAIKIARQATKRSAVLCYTEAFHGRSLMAMTLTSKIKYKSDCGPFAPEVYRLPFPDYFHYGKGLSEDEFIDQELQRLDNSSRSMVFIGRCVKPKRISHIDKHVTKLYARIDVCLQSTHHFSRGRRFGSKIFKHVFSTTLYGWLLTNGLSLE